jgi:5-methyltetrahydropteroyltriglutamate--homocysteine methyltransferase
VILPTESIGSIPRPHRLIKAAKTGNSEDPRLNALFDEAEIGNSILEAAKYIPAKQLGTTDACGFSPFCDDTSTSRDTAFAKIQARVMGTHLASELIAGD